MDAWSNRNPIPATECGIRGFPECNGYGLIGVELSAVTSTAPLPWNTYDVSTAAMPPGKEFAVAGTDRDQTFFYNFCRGTLLVFGQEFALEDAIDCRNRTLAPLKRTYL
jgi:hypothetical protein